MKSRKQIAILIDPGKKDSVSIDEYVERINESLPDYVFVGGSDGHDGVRECVLALKKNCNVPVILFPGSSQQFCKEADSILLISLLSGRNPEFLIGQHVRSALEVKSSGINVIPTAYILVDGGRESSVEKVSHTTSIDRNDIDTIVRTAVAGELLGFKMVYLEAGSGAKCPIDMEIISEVKSQVDVPIIVGGGLCSTSQIEETLKAGADIVVVGNHFERHIDDMKSFVDCVRNQ